MLILRRALAIILSFSMSMASAESVDEEVIDHDLSVAANLGFQCNKWEYLDKKWLDPAQPLMIINTQTGNWDVVQDTSTDEVTQKALNLWVSDSLRYFSCYRHAIEQVETSLRIVSEFREEYIRLHNINQSHIVEVSQKVHAFSSGENIIVKNFGAVYWNGCGRLSAGNAVTEEEAQKWAHCSLRYDRSLAGLQESIKSYGFKIRAEYLERVFKTAPEK